MIEAAFIDTSLDVPGWMPCDGKELKSDENKDVFDAIGKQFGGGDDTFKLPMIPPTGGFAMCIRVV